jgi:hypothetical protein
MLFEMVPSSHIYICTIHDGLFKACQPNSLVLSSVQVYHLVLKYD